MDGNKLTGLPSGIFDKNTKLTRLTISNNLMTTLPSGIFDQLTSLIYLCVASPILSSRSQRNITLVFKLFVTGICARRDHTFLVWRW